MASRPRLGMRLVATSRKRGDIAATDDTGVWSPEVLPKRFWKEFLLGDVVALISGIGGVLLAFGAVVVAVFLGDRAPRVMEHALYWLALVSTLYTAYRKWRHRGTRGSQGSGLARISRPQKSTSPDTACGTSA